MANRKQRRRREKDLRHDYDWVDEQGNVLGSAPAKDDAEKPAKAAKAAPAKSGARGRTPQPPSWDRVLKRTAIFAPVMVLLVFVLPAKNGNRWSAILTAVMFIAIFIPFSYYMDRVMWRGYQKRQGESAAKKPAAKSGKPGSKRG